MKYKIAPNFFSIIIILIIGGALVNEFDFQDFKFENPYLAAIYIIAIGLGIAFMIRKNK